MSPSRESSLRATCDNHILLEDEPAWHMLLDELERFSPSRG
jgi:hypothetical protein